MSVSAVKFDAEEDELEELKEMIKLLLRDKSSNNILLADVQFTEEDVENAVKMTVNSFNSMSPRTRMSWRHIPEDLLFLGTASWLMLSESFLQLRNQVSVPTDGMGVVGIDDKTQHYQQLREMLKRDFETKSRQVKNEINIASGFGSMSSGYVNVSRFTKG